MLHETLVGAFSIGGDMPQDLRNKSTELVTGFEKRLEYICETQRIKRQPIRPLHNGNVFCGTYQNQLFIGYNPSFSTPRVLFAAMTTKVPTGVRMPMSAFKEFLGERIGIDFAVVELDLNWHSLPEHQRNGIFDAVSLALITSELSREERDKMTLPAQPLFGKNVYPVQMGLAFILMPFVPSLTEIYENVVKPALSSRNLIPRRADEIVSNRAIMTDIWKSICEAQIIIADVTGLNPNVMYELGIAHTLGKETIIIHQKTDDSTKFPFDIAHVRILQYENTATGGHMLSSRLIGVVDSILAVPGASSLTG